MEIYQSSHKLLHELNENIKNLEKKHRYNIGEQIKEKSFEILLLISKIKNDNDKIRNINRALDAANDIQLSIKLLKDLDVFNDEQSVHLNQSIRDVTTLFEKLKNDEQKE